MRLWHFLIEFLLFTTERFDADKTNEKEIGLYMAGGKNEEK